MAESLDLDDIQGVVARGYGGLPYAAYLLLELRDADTARVLLARWATTVVTPARRAPRDSAVNIALTSTGVLALVGARALPQGFSEPFASGMVTDYRSRLLGDVGANDPGGWEWGGPATDPVHLVVLLYARQADRLAALAEQVTRDAHVNGMRVVRRLATERLTDREPFGFRDGISQPVLAGLPLARRGGDVVRNGEFVLGYVNEYGQRTERPLVGAGADPERILPRDPDGSSAADLGRNGSYLVFRQLRQDVAAFEAYLDRAAGSGTGTTAAGERERLAAKLVGRWRGSGASLTLTPDRDDPALANTNDFGYHEQDSLGRGCPIGAHVRRANPRDALAPRPGTDSSREVNRRHRLLRRGRAYGAESGPDAERGLHFLCLNTNLARQYEFVQHSWLNDPSFNGLVGVEDPLVGPRVDGDASFVEPAHPVRRRHQGIPQFVRVRGGGYFFLPGIRALRYLASAPAWSQEVGAWTPKDG